SWAGGNRPSGRRLSQLVGRAIVPDHPETKNVIASVAILGGAGAGRIRRDHAADRATHPACGVGCESSVSAGQLSVEPIKYDARLHADPVVARFEDVAEVDAQIDDDAVSQRLA